MDPLNVTANIIAVLQATNTVISICYDYSSAVKNSPWELSKAIEEIKNLRNVLETLEQLSRKAESADPTTEAQLPALRLLCESDTSPLVMCLLELEALEGKLAPPNWGGQAGSKKRALVQALRWPLKEGDTKRILGNIGRFKATLNLAITADQAALALSVRNMTREIHDITQENFTKLHGSFISMKIDDQREKIYRWLSPPDPSINHNQACKKRQAATGRWFVESEQFGDWKAKLDSFLWLYGIPGCGKTILASTIIDNVLQHCHLSRALVVAYFYFDFNDTEKQQHEKMIRSLIAQLLMQSANTPQALELLFFSCVNGERQPAADALLETLRQMIQDFDEAFIILDALDECKERQELLGDIEEIAEWKTKKIHMLAMSRREKEIEERIEVLVKMQEKICIQIALVNDDIRTYVHERLQTDWELRRWREKPEVQKEIERVLTSKADGMFRWAVCQLDALKSCLNLFTLRKTLSSLPKTLDDTYARILCDIEEEHSENALKILQWLTNSIRPLRIEEIAEVVAIDARDNPRFDLERRFPEPRDILAICSSLVTVTVEATDDPYGEASGERVRLAHFSVKEYLMSERIQAGPATRYSIRDVPANVSIAEVCLAYLLQFDKPNSLTVQTTEEFPLAKYAAGYWTQHARAAGKDASLIHQLIMELFLSKRDAYLNWIRLSDPDNSWRDLGITRRIRSIASPLYYTSLAGLVESAKLLLEKGADVNAQGGHYGNALQAASCGGHDQIVQRLLENGADVNAHGGYHGNALQAASRCGHDQIVQQLLDNEADANVQGGYYGNALQAASYGGYDQIAQWLLENGADANAQGGYFGNALQAASFRGYDRIVQRLLENGAYVNAQGGWYVTALQAASYRGHDRVVRRLLENEADVSAQGGYHGDALQAASCGGHDQIAQWLLENGADANTQGGYFGNALQAASFDGHDQIVQRLLENGADVNAQGGQYNTALQAASYRGHDWVVQRLLENGAGANAQGEYFGNALQVASYGGRDQIAQWLLENGADVNAQGGYFGNALQAASYGGHDQIVQRLLENGADVNAQGGWYDTALQAASYRGHDRVVRRLLENEADVSAQGGYHGNAL